MPQNNQFLPYKNVATSKPALANTDTFGNQLVSKGTTSAFNITAATVVKTGGGRLIKISVIVAGSAAGAAYDYASTSGVSAASEIFVIPNTVGIYEIDWPLATGLVIVPGTGQTIAVSYQ